MSNVGGEPNSVYEPTKKIDKGKRRASYYDENELELPTRVFWDPFSLTSSSVGGGSIDGIVSFEELNRLLSEEDDSEIDNIASLLKERAKLAKTIGSLCTQKIVDDTERDAAIKLAER